jgi:hypothetical protein
VFVVEEMQQKFCGKYPDAAVPSKFVIYKLMVKVYATQLVLDKNKIKKGIF